VPGHAYFEVRGWEGYNNLPIRVRDAMLEEIAEWREQEKPR
jgi:hypothetical protein